MKRVVFKCPRCDGDKIEANIDLNYYLSIEGARCANCGHEIGNHENAETLKIYIKNLGWVVKEKKHGKMAEKG